MLDLFESEIGHKVESLKYDGSELCDYWLEALQIFDPKVFKKKVLNLFPDFLTMEPWKGIPEGKEPGSVLQDQRIKDYAV